MVKIITDSICDLDESLLAPYDLDMLPLIIRLEDKEYFDKAEITHEQVWEAMERGILPKSSQVPAGLMIELFEKYAAAGQEFIYVAFSSVLSGCCNLARMLIEELEEKYPNVHMGVINSKAGSAGMGLIVLQLAHMAKDGVSFEKLMAHGQYLSEHIVHMIALQDTKWLVLGGRMNKLVGMASSALDIRALIHIDKEGYLKAFGTARGKKRMVKALCDEVLKRIKAFPEQLIAVSYSYEKETAQAVMDYLRAHLPVDPKFVVQPIGNVLTAYLGFSGVGVLFFDQRPPEYYYA